MPMTPEEVMAEAIRKSQEFQNSQQRPPMDIPKLNTGTPVIDDSVYRDLVMKALQPSFQPSAEDLGSARMKMWSAMAQPRQQGQSVIGNITGAMQQGVTASDLARDKARSEAMDTAKVASSINAQDTSNRLNNAKLQELIAKYPEEMKQLAMQTRDMAVSGRIKELQLLNAEFTNDPTNILEDLRRKRELGDATLGKTQAETGKEEALATRYGAEARYADAHAGAITSAGKEGVVKLDERNSIRYNKDGTMEHIRIGDPTYTFAQAKKELIDENKAQGKTGFFGGGNEPSLPEIEARVRERRENKVTRLAAVPGAEQVGGPTGPDTKAPGRPIVDLTEGVKKAQKPAETPPSTGSHQTERNPVVVPPVVPGRSTAPDIIPGVGPVAPGVLPKRRWGVKPGEMVPSAPIPGATTPVPPPPQSSIPPQPIQGTVSPTALRRGPVVPDTALQNSMQVDPQVQLSRDIAAMHLIQTELDDAMARGAPEEEIAQIQRDLAFRQDSLRKRMGATITTPLPAKTVGA